MQVTVALFGPYADLLPRGSQRGRATVDVAEGTTVAALLDHLGLPAQGRRFVPSTAASRADRGAESTAPRCA